MRRHIARAVTLATVACSDTVTAPEGPTTPYPPGPSAAPAKAIAVCPGVCAVAPRILFTDTTGLGTIYSINPNGTGLKLEDSLAVEGSWLPTYDHYLYSSHWYGPIGDIYTSPAPGGSGYKMTDNGAADYEPTSSPDGATIAFVSERDWWSNGSTEIYTLPAWGWEMGLKRLTQSPGQDRWPHWAPNGQAIVFASQRANVPAGYSATYHIWRMNVDGTNPVSLGGGIEGRHPVYSPNGARIAFTTRVRGGVQRIAVMNADGSNVVILANGLLDSMEPSWSRDGARIAFASNDPAWRGINTMNADGTNVVHVVAKGTHPKWSR